MLHEIETKKQELERNIAIAVQAELTKWQQENDLPVQNIYIDLTPVYEVGSPKRYEITSASVDLDYKP